MAYQSLRLEYLQIPPVSRAYTTACVLTTAAVVSSCSTHFQLFGLAVIWFRENEVWGPWESLRSSLRCECTSASVTLEFRVQPRELCPGTQEGRIFSSSKGGDESVLEAQEF